jgi:hypothetical protein
MQEKHAHSLLAEAPQPLPTGKDYRDLAGRIREIAGMTRLPVARRELIRLAAKLRPPGRSPRPAKLLLVAAAQTKPPYLRANSLSG